LALVSVEDPVPRRFERSGNDYVEDKQPGNNAQHNRHLSVSGAIGRGRLTEAEKPAQMLSLPVAITGIDRPSQRDVDAFT
jgi:hypothetical protein